MASNYPQLSPQGDDARRIASVVNLAMQGKLNATALVTLTPAAASTVLSDRRIGPDSFLGLMPLSASAAASLATTFVASRAAGSATLAHASDAATDRHFGILIIG